MLQCIQQAFLAYRFQQVVNRMRFECLQRIVIVGRGKYDGRWLLQQLQVLRRFQAVHAWHANIQQQHVRLLGCAQLQCLMAIGRFTADLTAADVTQHCP